jgi:hypothetical protein
MGKLVGQLVAYILLAPIVLYGVHLFSVGGFGTPFGMIVDDARMLAACPSKPGVVFEFILRSDADEYSYFYKGTDDILPFVEVNVDDEGALDAICDKVEYKAPPSKVPTKSSSD